MPTFIAFDQTIPAGDGGERSPRVMAMLTQNARHYGLVVEQDIDDVAEQLESDGLARLERKYGDDLIPVYVNPAAVKFIEPLRG